MRVVGGPDSRAGKILRPGRSGPGYLTVLLCVAGVSTTHPVHRLVCRAFHGAPPAGREVVSHADDQPANNCAANISWTSHAGNSREMVARGRSVQGERHHASKITDDGVRLIRVARGIALQRELAEMFRVAPATISLIQNGRAWTHVI